MPSAQGRRFLGFLDDLAHPDGSDRAGTVGADAFIDECLLPKLEDSAGNGWPDWAVDPTVICVAVVDRRGRDAAREYLGWLSVGSRRHPPDRIAAPQSFVRGSPGKPVQDASRLPNTDSTLVQYFSGGTHANRRLRLSDRLNDASPSGREAACV